MKKKFLFFATTILTFNSAIADPVSNQELCNVSAACKQVCKLNGIAKDEDQQLINRCSNDIVAKFNLN